MKTNTLIAWFAVILLFTSSASIVSADADSSRQSFDLSKLRKFYDDKNMDSDAKIQEILGYLKEEITYPSFPNIGGPGGGPIDTVYIQRVIIAVMDRTVDRETLLKALKDETEKNIRDRLKIALVTAGDTTFLADIQSFLQSKEDNLLRLAAAWALRGINVEHLESLKPVLSSLSNDTYSRIAIEDSGRVGIYKIYPVRQAAHEALTRMGENPKGWILEVALKDTSRIKATGSLLDDENPHQCVSVLRILSDYPGTETETIIDNFIKDSTGKQHLISAVEEAKITLNKIKNFKN